MHGAGTLGLSLLGLSLLANSGAKHVVIQGTHRAMCIIVIGFLICAAAIIAKVAGQLEEKEDWIFPAFLMLMCSLLPFAIMKIVMWNICKNHENCHNDKPKTNIIGRSHCKWHGREVRAGVIRRPSIGSKTKLGWW